MDKVDSHTEPVLLHQKTSLLQTMVKRPKVDYESLSLNMDIVISLLERRISGLEKELNAKVCES